MRQYLRSHSHRSGDLLGWPSRLRIQSKSPLLCGSVASLQRSPSSPLGSLAVFVPRPVRLLHPKHNRNWNDHLANPIVSCPLKILLPLIRTVLIFCIASLLFLCASSTSKNWERIASRQETGLLHPNLVNVIGNVPGLPAN